MSGTGKQVWRGGIDYDCSRKTGVGVFAHFGHVSPCGEWVDGGAVRWPLTADWCDTEAEALARLAPEIAEIGARLIKQAAKLLEAARAVEVTA